jgi:hypothetical protein
MCIVVSMKFVAAFGLAVALLFGALPGAAIADSATAAAAGSGERLAHPAVKGSLGPWPAAEVWLTQSSQVEDGPFTAHVAVKGPDGRRTVYTLPPPDETESAFMMKVRSVMFRSIDGQPERSLIVLYSAAQIGPGQAPYFGACVYAWDGSAFVRDGDAEARVSGARNSAEVARRLAARKAR